MGHPNSAANQLPTLSAKELKLLDDSAEALIQAGISSALIKQKGSKGVMINFLEFSILLMFYLSLCSCFLSMQR